MSAIKRPQFRDLLPCAAALAMLVCGTARGGDWFSHWKASGDIQLLQIDRPQGDMALDGTLDSEGHGTSGYNQDGPVLRKVEAKIGCDLGSPDWSLTLGTQTDLVNTKPSDLFVQWNALGESLRFRAGQMRVPFGLELQSASSDLQGIQRSLVYGFENYGHVGNWGLGLLNERGWGLRADSALPVGGPFVLVMQASGQQASGTGYNPALAGIGRAALRAARGAYALEAGFSSAASRANLGISSDTYVPLGSQDASSAELSLGAGLGGKATVLSWSPDLSADLGPLHGRAEWVMQSLGWATRGGGHLDLSLDLPSWQAKPSQLYARIEQAYSGFGDGVHRPGTLYRSWRAGLTLPLLQQLSLKLEHLALSSDDFPAGFPSDQIEQAQLEMDL